MVATNTIRSFIDQLDEMILAFECAYEVGRDTGKEREAKELLKVARLRLAEDIDGVDFRQEVDMDNQQITVLEKQIQNLEDIITQCDKLSKVKGALLTVLGMLVQQEIHKYDR